jgi:site-specific DNA-methyltransferase (adenine-specific)
MGKRKNPYIPGIAQISFKPDFDWEFNEAKALHQNAQHSISTIDKILFEDSIEGMKKVPDDSIDLIIADPPFGINFDGKGSQYNRDQELVIEDYGEIIENYAQFSEQWISQMPRIMKDTASAYIFSGWTNLNDILCAIQKNNLTLINHIIWRYQFGVFTKKKFVSSHYHILFVVKDSKKYFFNKIEHYPLDIWDIPRTYMPGQKKNGTKLPEDVVIRAINFSSKPGDLVLDPFMGNGTTAVSAKMTFRHYIGFEKNKNLEPLLKENLDSVTIGQKYVPYHTLIPSLDELAEKYPAVKKFKESQGNDEIAENKTEK